MADSIKRRDFLKTTSLLGASIAMANTSSASRFLSNDSEIKNTYFTISFDKGKGEINVHRSNGVSLLWGGTVSANSNLGKHLITSGNYKHTLHPTTFSDALGQM